MSQSFRLPTGGRIDRRRSLGFRFDGRKFEGHPGDSLASALLANGVRLMGRSFKYHRPRGLLADGHNEPNALVEVRSGARREPNSRAPLVDLFDGLEAVSQNRFPSLQWDLMAVNSLFKPFFAAGFYYKTFMWPASWWEKLYEPLIRRAAGLGRGTTLPDPDHYERATIHCDLLVVGAGPAGLMAALTAARSGARVVVLEDRALPGGQSLAEAETIADRPADLWAAETWAELATLPKVRLLPRTTAVIRQDDGLTIALERVADHLPEPPPFQPRQRLWRILARATVLATGAWERPQLFPGNDRPGVMLAATVRRMIRHYAVKPGTAAAILTSCDDGWRTAAALEEAGIPLAALIDTRRRDQVDPALTHPQAVFGARIRTTSGRLQLKGIEIEGPGTPRRAIACDLLAVSGGWEPATNLTTHLGCRPVWSAEIQAFVPGKASEVDGAWRAVGAAAGVFSLPRALAQAAEVTADLGFGPAVQVAVGQPMPDRQSLPPLDPVNPSKVFLDPQHDVTLSDIHLAVREGYDRIELTKRYTTMGMATDQGKAQGALGVAALAAALGQEIPATGTWTARPPAVPVAIGALAGPHAGTHFRPTRLTPTHDWSAAAGASFMETGPWLRPQWYARPGESDWLTTVNREVSTTRTSVGFCDVSTLGKIDLQGPDAGTLLDRVYVNAFSTLAIGKARYGLMLREDGIVFDDGTTTRLAPEQFLMTTTTANAVRVMEHLDYCLQVLWPELDVQIASVTDQWAQVALAGPRSGTVLEALAPGLPVDDGSLPYMGFVAGEILDGIPARIFRLSFSGERAYEIAVPASAGARLMQAIAEAGQPFGIAPYGLEALGVMRIEKGHVAGNELNGQTTAADLGLGRMQSTKKDFIGRTMSLRPGMQDPDRPRLIGLKPVDGKSRLYGGAALLPDGAPFEIPHAQGHVTSVAYSPTLGHPIGLALCRGGTERVGERIRAIDRLRDSDVLCEILSPHFYDPSGERLHVRL